MPPLTHRPLPAAPSTMDYHHQTKRLFIGLDNGYISEFSVANDYNRVKLIKNYAAHQGRVKSALFSLDTEWLLSIGRDKYFVWHCSERGHRIGNYLCQFACTALQ